MRATASIIVATFTKSPSLSTSDISSSTLGSGEGSFRRRKSSLVNEAVSAECSRTSATMTSTAVLNGSLIAGGGGNGGVVSACSLPASSNTEMR
jgi:hypothetical protein